MSRRTRWAFLALVIAQVLVLVGIAGANELRLRTGQEVVLQTVPVDPRDLLRGDYVSLRYEISTITAGPHRFEAGDAVFVRLVDDEGTWRAAGVAREMDPEHRPTIRGTVRRAHEDGTLEVAYGIETYFVPEGRGLEIETAGDVDVVVAVDRSGRSAIKHLVVDGARWTP